MMTEIDPNTVNVLIVEDDEIDVEVLKRKFKKYHIINPLHRASCGVDALEILRGENKDYKIMQPCLILVDINMPQMDGLQFLEEVRKDENLKKNVAFILTSSDREADIEAAYGLNAAGYFLKGDLDKLTAMLCFYRDINKFAVN